MKNKVTNSFPLLQLSTLYIVHRLIKHTLPRWNLHPLIWWFLCSCKVRQGEFCSTYSSSISKKTLYNELPWNQLFGYVLHEKSGHNCLTYISIVHNIKGQNCPFILPHFQQSESNALQYPIHDFKILYPFETSTNELPDYPNQKHESLQSW